MPDEDAGEGLRAVEGDPRELAAVVVQKTGRETDPPSRRHVHEGARPEYAGEVPDLSQYNTIFIGAPAWWGDWPMICCTFFESGADAFDGNACQNRLDSVREDVAGWLSVREY